MKIENAEVCTTLRNKTPEALTLTFTGNKCYSTSLQKGTTRRDLANNLRLLAYELERDELTFCKEVRNNTYIKG